MLQTYCRRYLPGNTTVIVETNGIIAFSVFIVYVITYLSKLPAKCSFSSLYEIFLYDF